MDERHRDRRDDYGLFAGGKGGQHLVQYADFGGGYFMRAGGEAMADTQWQITTPQGDVIKESGGALPTHMLAPGNYVVNATSQGRTFRREFTLQHSDALQVEIVVQ